MSVCMPRVALRFDLTHDRHALAPRPTSRASTTSWLAQRSRISCSAQHFGNRMFITFASAMSSALVCAPISGSLIRQASHVRLEAITLSEKGDPPAPFGGLLRGLASGLAAALESALDSGFPGRLQLMADAEAAPYAADTCAVCFEQLSEPVGRDEGAQGSRRSRPMTSMISTAIKLIIQARSILHWDQHSFVTIKSSHSLLDALMLMSFRGLCINMCALSGRIVPIAVAATLAVWAHGRHTHKPLYDCEWCAMILHLFLR